MPPKQQDWRSRAGTRGKTTPQLFDRPGYANDIVAGSLEMDVVTALDVLTGVTKTAGVNKQAKATYYLDIHTEKNTATSGYGQIKLSVTRSGAAEIDFDILTLGVGVTPPNGGARQVRGEIFLEPGDRVRVRRVGANAIDADLYVIAGIFWEEWDKE